MNRGEIVVVCLVGAGCIVGGYALHARVAGKSTDVLEHEFASLKRQQEQQAEQLRLTSDLVQGIRVQVPQQGGPSPPADSGSPASSNAASPPSTPAAHFDVPVDQVLFAVDNGFKRDRLDGRAGSMVAAGIRDTLSAFLTNRSSIESLECRESICRLSGIQESEDSYREFVAKVRNSHISPQFFWTKQGETHDGRPILTMYMAREGAQLPRPE